ENASCSPSRLRAWGRRQLGARGVSGSTLLMKSRLPGCAPACTSSKRKRVARCCGVGDRTRRSKRLSIGKVTTTRVSPLVAAWTHHYKNRKRLLDTTLRRLHLSGEWSAFRTWKQFVEFEKVKQLKASVHVCLCINDLLRNCVIAE